MSYELFLFCISFINSFLKVRSILRKRFSCLLFEETHQVAGVGEMEIIRQLADGAVGEEQFVLQFLQQTLLQQMGGGYAELCHDRGIQRDAADVKQVGILLHPLHGADVLFQQVFELESVIVLRDFRRQMVGDGIRPVDKEQQVIEHGHDEVVRICHRVQQLLLYLAEQTHVLRQFFGRSIEIRRRVGLIIIQQAINKLSARNVRMKSSRKMRNV